MGVSCDGQRKREPSDKQKPTNEHWGFGEADGIIMIASERAEFQMEWWLPRLLSLQFPLRRENTTTALKATFVAGVALFLFGCGGKGSTTPSPGQEVAISVQPLSQTVPIGETATFTVTATGTAPLSYQWSENGAEIAGATSSSYTTPAISLGAGGSTSIGSFQVKVSNQVNSVTSNAATLTAGPRSPKTGDLRYLLFQQVDLPGLFDAGGSGAGSVTVELAGAVIDESDDNTVGSPLGVGSSYICGDGTCVWPYTYQVLPSPMTGLNMYYRGGDYSSVMSDLQAFAAPNVVFTSLDLEPAENAYAVSWVQTAQTGGFDYRIDPVIPAGTNQQPQIQAQAALDGTESRVVTAVSFDESGNAVLISYGWTGDTKTMYETQTTIVPPGGAIGTKVLSAATTMASEGYIISAFGGNDTAGYILVGMRVQGDNLPRSIEDSYTDQQPYFTTVVYLRESGAITVVNEQ